MISALLDLWSLGHSAGQVAGMLGISRWKVYATVEQARDIGDPRATLHVGANGRPIGNGRRGMVVILEFPDVEVVPAIRKLKCVRGHPRTPENVTKKSLCRVCAKLRKRAERARK